MKGIVNLLAGFILLQSLCEAKIICPTYCDCSGIHIHCRKPVFSNIPEFPSYSKGTKRAPTKYISIFKSPELETIQDNAFADHPEVLRLELAHNSIKIVTENAFKNLGSLVYLSLTNNRLEILPDNVFIPTMSLKDLDLSNNQLKTLPKSLEYLLNLESITLINNPLHCPCNIMDFGLNLIKIEDSSRRVRCSSPREVAGYILKDLAMDYKMAINTTRHLGYIEERESANNFLRDGLLKSWPMPHCPIGDLGGKNIEMETSEETVAPLINKAPQSAYGVAGDKIILWCDAEGKPEPQIYWIVPSNDTHSYRLMGRRRILEITELHDYNEGAYTCVAKNSVGMDTRSASVRIIPPERPRILHSSSPEENSAVIGEDFTLSCTASGRPKPKIDWIWDARFLPKQIKTSDKYLIETQGEGPDFNVEIPESFFENNENHIKDIEISRAYEEKTTVKLTIKNLTEQDTEGQYRCYASNRLSTATVSTIIRPVNLNRNIPTEDPVMPDEETKKFESSESEEKEEDVIEDVIDAARKRIEAAVQQTAERLRDPSRQRSSSDISSLFRQPSKAALELAKAAEVYEIALEEVTKFLREKQNKLKTQEGHPNSHKEDLDEDDQTTTALGTQLTTEQLAILSQLSGCQQPLNVDPCARQLCFHLKYRSIDGKCNNFNNPLWGAALSTFYRLVPPEYENGVNTPIGWNPERLYFGYPKPSARLISRELLADASKVMEIERNMKSFQLDMMRKTNMYDRQMGYLNSSISTISSMDNMSILDYEKLMEMREKDFYKLFPDQEKNVNTIFNERMTKTVKRTLFDEDTENSGYLFQWGQFVDHDLVLTPVDFATSRFSDGLNCNDTCVNDPPCFPILVPPNDPRIKHQCLGFARSTATCGSGSTSFLTGRPHHREQINQITGFIDASNVYGSDQIEADELRENEFSEGKLRVGVKTEAGKHLLPFNIRGQVDCQADPNQDFVPCFKAGDHRNNENVNLIITHVLWMRQHNLLADKLRLLNPHWTGDRLYQEARKIVGAQMQIITYEEWLPKILGPAGMKLMDEKYTGYDDEVNPTISNEFSTAAFRFGHTMVPPILFRLDKNWNPITQGHLMLRNAFFAPERLMKDGGIDPLIRGLLYHGIKERTKGPALNSELTEKLFSMAHELALDLASLNVQRGRDHAIPGYTVFANMTCGLLNKKYPDSFDDLKHLISSDGIREKMRQVYGHPGNVDLFVGGVLEDLLPGARVGPTFACILADQFNRLRKGDRFWYEAPGVFTSVQKAELKRAGRSLSRVICDNGDDIDEVTKDAFKRPKSKADIVKCNSGHVPTLNMAFWKDCPGSVNNDISYSLRSYETETHAQPELIVRQGRSAPTQPEESKLDKLEKMVESLKKEIEKLSGSAGEL